MSDVPPLDETLLETLAAVARRLDAAARLTPTRVDDTSLAAVARTAAMVLDAQAASIALHDPATDRLVFTAAAGPQAGDVVGLAIDAASGIAGYAFSTGQPLAVADVSSDPRFDRTVAEATGYVPGSILATPLVDDDGPLGVLEVLDRRGGSFTLRDIDVAGALADEAAILVRRGRLDRDAGALLRGALTAVAEADADEGAGTDGGPTLTAADIDAIVGEVTAGLQRRGGDDDPDPTWRLAEAIARLRDVDPDSIDLAADWLDALIRRKARRAGPRGGPGR